ncbi:MAG TPA: hypothetical protein VII43_00120 [Opitutaceae bacterium]
MQPAAPAIPSTGHGGARASLRALPWVTAVAFLLVLQNFCLDLLPRRRVRIAPESIQTFPGKRTFAYVFAYDGSEPDRWPSARSRVEFHEDEVGYSRRLHSTDEVLLVGGDRFSHEPGRIVFATTDNTDPRTNGRRYFLTEPILYSGAIGDAAALVLAACVLAWWRIGAGGRREPSPPPAAASRWRWHLAGASALFLLGLYCNTGTLAPYACTSSPLVFPQNGYAYNGDHRHFRVLFDFVDGSDRPVWDHALLLRRILFPVLGWPLMKLLGFELGGTLASLALNLGAFAWALVLLRRMIGERAAIFAAWMLALYPGAAYWAGLPYPYALICPASLLLMIGLMRLAGGAAGGRMLGISLAMGVAYLGYDLAVFFLPATVVALCWRRRFAGALASAAVQLAPSAAWMAILTYFFHQPVENPNSGIYHTVLLPFLHPAGPAQWWDAVARSPAIGADIFFAANFLFLPALFLFAVVVNPVTSRIRLQLAESVLLLCALALFLLLNGAPATYGGWAMNGTWISRLYQPVFPALLLFTARWWQGLPPLGPRLRPLVALAVAGASLGDALVVFGPILGNPGRVSETAFYRFYDHTDAHFLYEANLASLGRRPLGFPRAQVPAPTAKDIAAADARRLEEMRGALRADRATLVQNKLAYRETGRALAGSQSDLYAARLALRRVRGEITAEEAKSLGKDWQTFLSPAVRLLMDDPSLAPSAQQPEPPPQGEKETAAAIDSLSGEIGAVQASILQAQRDLSQSMAETVKVRLEIDQAQRSAGSPRS